LNRWQRLCQTLVPFEAIEPGLEGLRWSIYLYHPSKERAGASFGKAWFMQARRWFLSLQGMVIGKPRKIPVWFALHGSTPSHLLPFQAVMHELSGRGLNGLAVGPYPFEALSLVDGWRQMPMDIGFPEAGPVLFHLLYKKASAIAPDLRKALIEAGLWSEEQAPGSTILVDWIWNALRFDWDIAQRLQRLAPRVLLLGSDLGILRNPLARHARALGAYTLVLQHGLQGEYAGSVSTNEVSLWGDYHRRQTISLGAPPAALVVDGSPRMDAILKLVNDPATRSAARKTLNIPQDVPVVLHISEGIIRLKNKRQEITQRFLQAAPLAFRAVGRQVTYLLRPHPVESDTDWDFLGLQDCLRVVPKDQIGLYELISAADVVTTIMSSGGLEAIWCGRPVLFYQPEDLLPVHDFVASGGGLAVSNAREWTEAALNFACDPLARREQIESTAAFCADTLAFPGEAAHRITDRIIAHMG